MKSIYKNQDPIAQPVERLTVRQQVSKHGRHEDLQRSKGIQYTGSN